MYCTMNLIIINSFSLQKYSFFIAIFAMISKVQLFKSVLDSHPTVRYLQKKFNLEGCRYKQLPCDDDFEDIMEAKRPPRREKLIQDQTKKLQSNRRCFNYRKLSGDENSDPLLEVKKPARQIKTVQNPAQQATVTVQKPVQQEKPVCKPAQQGRTAQQESLTTVQTHRPLCQMPSWQHNQRATEKLVLRRTAVCDNIERQLMNDHGISLRKLRKFIVVEHVLHEVNLL